jgi:hypothetical protein
MSNDDLSYFVRRMCDEERAAAATNDPDVAAVHHDLASRYRAILSAYGHPSVADGADPCSQAA